MLARSRDEEDDWQRWIYSKRLLGKERDEEFPGWKKYLSYFLVKVKGNY